MISRTSLCLWLLLSAALMSACGGGGGGGGTDTPTPVTPTPVTPTPANTFTISGSVITPSGSALSGVQLGLSGTSSSSTISNANGAYTFTALANGAYVVTPSAARMTFSPTTKSVTIQGQSASGVTFARTYESTQSITDYMAILHSQKLTTFSTNEKALSATMAATGSFTSGAHYSQSASGYLTLVQGFTNTSLTFINSKAQTMGIDTPTISALMTSYALQDAAYADTYYRNVPWGLTGSSLTSVISTVKGQINDVYALTILRIP